MYNSLIHLINIYKVYKFPVTSRSSLCAHISLNMETCHRIRTYQYQIKLFPQTKPSTKLNFDHIDRSRTARISLERDNRIALLLETVGLCSVPPEIKRGGEEVTMNVLMYNYQYCFNT